MASSLRVVNPCDVSVVIQGPLYRDLGPDRGILRCISSIKEHLPGAEIIVSTWEREDIFGLSGCKVIVSIEPPDLCGVTENKVNTNRQIFSTRIGVEAATRLYVLKFRADHILEGKALIAIGDYDDLLLSGDRLFRRPITMTNLFIRNPVRVPMLFHLSDIIQFGLREDILELWCQNLLTHNEQFLSRGPMANPFGNFIGYSDWRMVPEQAITLGWLRSKGFVIPFKHVCYINAELLDLWEGLLANNFRVLDWRKSEVDYPPRFLNNGYSVKTIYSPDEIARAARLSSFGRRLRLIRVYINQYIIGCLSLTWCVSAASILLFSMSPRLATNIRSFWRRARQVNNESSFTDY